MQMLLAVNAVVMAAFFLFLIREEIRFSRLSKKINETKQDLTLIVHRLRSPLANLRKYNEFLLSKEFGTLSLSQLEAISKVQQSLGEFLIIFGRLIARSRLDELQLSNKGSVLDVRDAVRGVINAIQPIADRKRHNVTLSAKKKIRIVTDPLLFHGILDEILSNALHYTPDGGKIGIVVLEEGQSVRIDVSDTGIGISPGERSHIFTKYFRGTRARPLFDGNGLGLSFAKKFTEKLGGDLRFVSSLKKGSTFTVVLPKKAMRYKKIL